MTQSIITKQWSLHKPPKELGLESFQVGENMETGENGTPGEDMEAPSPSPYQT